MEVVFKRPAFINGVRYRANRPVLVPNELKGKLPKDVEVLDEGNEPGSAKKPKSDDTKALSELKPQELPLPPKSAK